MRLDNIGVLMSNIDKGNMLKILPSPSPVERIKYLKKELAK